jgi:hypothetical protein
MTTKKVDLTEVLQSLLQIDDLKISESETSDVIKTDIVDIAIEEVIVGSSTTSYTDYITLSFNENIQKDPLGAGVEPTWVLGVYIPTGITDTKRSMTFNSFKLY